MFPLQSALNSLHGLESKQITGRQQIAERFRERNRPAQPHRRQSPFDKRVSFESKVTSNSIHNSFFELSCILLLCGYLKISDTFVFLISIRTIICVSDSCVNERACLNGDIPNFLVCFLKYRAYCNLWQMGALCGCKSKCHTWQTWW